MFGDCQGNLCAVDIGRILAKELRVPLPSLEKHRRGSWLWSASGDGAAAMPAPGSPRSASREVDREDWDVVVAGGGAAGRAAADAMAGPQRVLLVERLRRRAAAAHAGRERSPVITCGTVVGVSPATEGWLVLVQDEDAITELRARAVVVATGAYMRPREQRPIAGPRPSGILTSDLAWRALDEGLLPGRVVALRTAMGAVPLIGALQRAGARVAVLDEPPLEVRGTVRLEAIRTAGGWIAADSLILDDELAAQTFLLRPLGLVDGVPGRPAPVDETGGLGLDGLWATGCCVEPDPAHAGCARHGDLVGRAVLTRLSPSTRPAGAIAG
jgi:hypothetical protein